jgi:aryl-alcohol dehydrogenase-like predicted oxidoreductase
MITIGGDLRVGRVGYGAMRLTGADLLGDYPDRDGGIALLREAVQAGVTLIDTADIYGPHSNELLIRDALHPYPEDLVIATKGGMVRGGRELSTIDAIGNPNYLRQCAYMSARRLAPTGSACTTCTAAGRQTSHSRTRSAPSPSCARRA